MREDARRDVGESPFDALAAMNGSGLRIVRFGSVRWRETDGEKRDARRCGDRRDNG